MTEPRHLCTCGHRLSEHAPLALSSPVDYEGTECYAIAEPGQAAEGKWCACGAFTLATVPLPASVTPDPMEQAAHKVGLDGDHLVWLHDAKRVRDQAVEATIETVLVAWFTSVANADLDDPSMRRLMDSMLEAVATIGPVPGSPITPETLGPLTARILARVAEAGQ